MKITHIKLGKISVPLKTPFKTALRTVESIEDIIVEIHTDTGNIGYGEAPPTGVITGDTSLSIIGAIKTHIAPSIIGHNIENFEELMFKLHSSIVGNTSAKAAVDIALYDLYGQLYKAPVYKLLGGYRKNISTDITISVNDPDEMVADSIDAIKLGYETLKVKVGKDSKMDIKRLSAIRSAVGNNINIRIDANQGWKPKEAIRTLKQMEDLGLNLELVEQPVAAYDIEGMKLVTDNVNTPVLADESVFSERDALKILREKAADLINIKLMKTGGINKALKIISMAEIYDVECMIGCMLEAKVSVNAAVHLAMAKKIITKIDLDGPILCKSDPVIGGAIFDNSNISVEDQPGFGVQKVEGIKYI